jgi:PAS domain-containing protein
MAPPRVEMVLLKQLASCLATPMFVTNRVGDLAFFNEPAEPLVGVRFDEMGPIGLAEWPKLLRMTDEQGAPLKPEARPLPVALATRRPAHRKLWVQGRAGAPRQIGGTGIPLIALDGELLGALGLFWVVGAEPVAGRGDEDLTGQHEVELILLRRLAGYLAAPIFIIDGGGNLLFFNDAGAPILGCRYEEVASLPAPELYRSFAPADEDGSPIGAGEHPLWSARMRREPVHGRICIRDRQGQRRRIELSAVPLVGQSARMLGVVGFFWEIDEA